MHKFKEIDIQTWARKDHYEFFMENFQFPHTTITAQIDVTKLKRFCAEKSLSLFHSTVFLISQTLNEIPEFRQRTRPDSVIEWESVHPSYTVLTDDQRFLFCDVEYSNSLEDFHRRSLEVSQKVKEENFEGDLHKEDNRLFMSCLPWVSFTQMSHPIHSAKFDSTPRVAWGKVAETRDGFFMPLNIQAHHALVDGLHLGRAFENFQRKINEL